MPRRIEIELTSRREDGSWSWRAPGARQPRGSVEADLLPAGAAVGDVLRAEAEFEIDGIYVTAVLTPKAERLDDGDRRIEILGSGRQSAGGVSVTMAPGTRRRSLEDGAAGAQRGPRPDRPGRRSEKTDGERRSRSRERERSRSDRPATRAIDGEPRRAAERSGPRGPAASARPPRSRGETAERRERRKLEPVTTHRNAALAALRPEQLPVAEQLLRGGIPAVRRAIEEQNTRARSEDRAEISPEPLLAMAEELLPTMTLAAWKDRAVVVRTAGRDAPLREVRSVVAGSSAVTLDDEARDLLAALRESLETRATALRESWLGRITSALDGDRVADALRLSSRPPEPSTRVPGELAVRLAAAAGAAMSADLSDESWVELLEAVIASPVRRIVKPAGLPADPGEELLRVARRAAGLVPELARMLGLPIPPPPGPRRQAAVGVRRS